ncbi:hypothetical protein [Lysobacter sp. CA199]|uniref:hypothetical protein n=1 Tax=Lysobacter sp. CA199 TaxID=3455608 RepID=UPI003F8D23EB
MSTPIRRLVLCALMAFAAACSSMPKAEPPRQDVRVVVSLDEAKRLMLSGQVEELFQPHQGPTTLMLKDGGSRCFVQPHLDWVFTFLKENGLQDKIAAGLE